MINRQYVPIVRRFKSILSCKRPGLAHQVRRLSTGEFDIFKKLKDSTNPEESKDDARKPSDKVMPRHFPRVYENLQVIKLVDEILNLTLIEAADLCDLCQEKLAERNGPAFNNGFIPGRTPFPHPHTFFSGTPPLGDYNVTGMGMVSPGMAQMGAGMPMGVAPYV
ncbi:hypothetical protein BEWA_026950 [Theileria equi strain WA]|uniref:Uncharacterized protein n=1 Tax=Theileria equi strain WA TaxID=1537102 RepID=L0AXU9_THEEQ|nr:hypothetical protein BEWA_026950 [Theileria equi strain WA]AFZ79846.1 hypothetical protein BEWA_026950 [Theileria equi strain WA]|eukprot:XP_004829512.1 hypothetical protein BEWA_026950 [Theileria equi strain WA]